jgi:hypothetical protein
LPLASSNATLAAFKEAIENLNVPHEPSPAVAENTSNEVETTEKDIICSDTVCIDLGKEKPLRDFRRDTIIAFETTNPVLPQPSSVSKYQSFSDPAGHFVGLRLRLKSEIRTRART